MKDTLHTFTESALYNPVDDPEVFAGFCFALIIINWPWSMLTLMNPGRAVPRITSTSGRRDVCSPVAGLSPPFTETTRYGFCCSVHLLYF
jgi:hypothetical protein